MSGYNNRQYGPQPRGGYHQPAPYVPYANQGYAYQNAPQKPKKSGATYSKISKGKMEGLTAVNAWRKTQHGLMEAKCFPASREIHKGKQNGHDFLRYTVEITNKSIGTSQTYWCLMRMDTRKIVIQELGLVISPNGSGYTASGKRVTGFFGRNVKTR